jgi:hypothetical protein
MQGGEFVLPGLHCLGHEVLLHQFRMALDGAGQIQEENPALGQILPFFLKAHRAVFEDDAGCAFHFAQLFLQQGAQVALLLAAAGNGMGFEFL